LVLIATSTCVNFTPSLHDALPIFDPITKRQNYLYRDVQVAEFAAPCDAVEIARVANVLGRIYAGDAEDQCELVWEGWPGCGMLRSEEHTSELQSRGHLVCRHLLEE